MTDILLQELYSSDLSWLMQSATYSSIPSETILADPNQPSDHVFLILEGMAAIAAPIRQAAIAHAFSTSSAVSAQSITALSQILPGDIANISTILDFKLLPYSVISESQCQVLSIARPVLLHKLQDDLSFASRFYRSVALLMSARHQRLVREFEYQNIPVRRSPLRQSITLFAELQDSDLDWLATVGSVQSLPAQAVLLPSGRSPDALHIVLEGALLLSHPVKASNLVAQTLAPAQNPAPSHQEVARLSRGDLVGEMRLVNAHDLTLCASALRDSQVLSIPRWRLAAKLLHDIGFAARFYCVLATLLATEYETMLHQLHAATLGFAGEKAEQSGDRDDLSRRLLTRISLAEARFEWLLKRLQAQQENGRDLQW
jgi:CRP-like cAMP-binding protein